MIGPIDVTFSGTTAVTCYLVKDTLYTVNSGDSRAIVGSKNQKNNKWKARSLTHDHKPELKREEARIVSKGGRVEPCIDENGDYIGPNRVWLKDENLPGLAMSRSLGDLVGASVGVSWEPGIPI